MVMFGRPILGAKGLRYAGMILGACAAISAPNSTAQGVVRTQATAGSTANIPLVTADVQTEGRVRTLTFVGRRDDGVVFTESDTGVGTRLLLAFDRIEDVRFHLDFDRSAVYKATRERNWDRAANILLPALRGAVHYLDLVNNNADRLALDLGDYVMRGAEQKIRAARTGADTAIAHKQYAKAFTLLKYVTRAKWSPVANIAELNRVRCLQELSKPKTAGQLFETIEEPMVGDAAFGLYWLVGAELSLQRGDFREAMDAAVKSLCFENKDIDTFPDALLISARCYEELQNWHRARDVYFEIARIFPNTVWQLTAINRLKFIREKGFTSDEEKSPIENVFFGLDEDINELVDELLEEKEKEKRARARPGKVAGEDIDLETAE